MTSPLPKKLDVLRPPLVWNFPIERVIDMKNALLLKEKNETAKIEIRKVALNICYKDHRVERFMELFNLLYKDAIDYSKKKGNSWEYTFTKILNVFQIEYQYTPTMAVDDKKFENNNTTNLNETSEKTMNNISAI